MRGLALLVPDEQRHVITVDNNDMLSAAAFSAHFLISSDVAQEDPLGCANTIKTLFSSVFYHGYQAGLKAANNQLDPNIWKV